jgi:Flp pilus assembly CpaF family ATPase
MKLWYCNVLDNRRFACEAPEQRICLGRHVDSDVVLSSPFVADRAAVLTRSDSGWKLTSLGSNGCVVDGHRVSNGDSRIVPLSATIEIFPYSISLQAPHITPASDDHADPNNRVSDLLRDIHVQLLEAMEIVDAQATDSLTDEYLLALEQNIEYFARSSGLEHPEHSDLTNYVAGQCVRGSLISQLLEPVNGDAHDSEHGRWSRIVSAVPHLELELTQLIEYVRRSISIDNLTDLSQKMQQVEELFWGIWREASRKLFNDFRNYLAYRQIKKQIKDIVFGFGPLEDLLGTPTITEIMVVSSDRIYIEKCGVIENSGRQFVSDEVTLTIIERIVSRIGRRIDKSCPLVDARLPDGSRVNAVVPPLAISGPCLTIRKFPERRMSIDDLIFVGALTPAVASLLKASVVKRRNILISGGTGSGKTTLLNCLSDFIPDKERIVTIEDTAELQIGKEHVVRMETKPANAEGAGEYSINDLVRNALRMRPDRIVVGECRGKEALAMLQAMNTGHNGSLTTLHANSAADAILRLETMVQDSTNTPLNSIHRQIVSAVDLIVQLTRLRDGRRLVTQVTEVAGIDQFKQTVRLNDIFVLEESNGRESLVPTGVLPSFLDELVDAGLIELDTLYR